jgi:hypothetical protein
VAGVAGVSPQARLKPSTALQERRPGCSWLLTALHALHALRVMPLWLVCVKLALRVTEATDCHNTVLRPRYVLQSQLAPM